MAAIIGSSQFHNASGMRWMPRPVVVARGQRRRQRTDSHPIAHRLRLPPALECTAGAGEDQHRHLGVGAGALDGVDQRLAVAWLPMALRSPGRSIVSVTTRPVRS
jgi:hypothetical protein